MIIQENKLIQLFEPSQNGDKTAIYAFWVLHKGIIPHINNKSGEAFPARKKLSTVCRLSLPTIDNCLEYLSSNGIINIQKRYDEETKINKSNVYSIETDLIKTVGKLKSEKNEETVVEGSQPSLQGVVNPVDKGSQPSLQGVVNPVDTNLQVEFNLQDELTCNPNFSNENFPQATKEKVPSQPLAVNPEEPIPFTFSSFYSSNKLTNSCNKANKHLTEPQKQFLAWFDSRTKSTRTEGAFNLNLKKIMQYDNPALQLAVIEKCIASGWRGLQDLYDWEIKKILAKQPKPTTNQPTAPNTPQIYSVVDLF